jgi:FkbM family methyltransferase
MRLELLYNPRLLCERLAELSLKRRRLAKLRGTVAACLKTGHIDSLELLELLRAHPPRVIYDIGANVGTWSLLAKAVFPYAEIHAFEPLPFHFRKFQQNTETVDGVFLHEVALGSQSSRTVLNVTDFSDASSVLPLTETGRKQWNLQQVQELPVQIHRLDDWISAHNLPNPDLIKLDVQGFELEVLRGAERALAGAGAILAEVSFFEIYRGQCLFHEITEHLSNSGFRLVALGYDEKRTIPLLQSEALYLSTEIAAHLYENL